MLGYEMSQTKRSSTILSDILGGAIGGYIGVFLVLALGFFVGNSHSNAQIGTFFRVAGVASFAGSVIGVIGALRKTAKASREI